MATAKAGAHRFYCQFSYPNFTGCDTKVRAPFALIPGMNCTSNCKLYNMYVHGLITCYGVAVMAEWLRRWTRNPMGYSRAGSNPVHSEVAVLVAAISVQSIRFAKWTSMLEN